MSDNNVGGGAQPPPQTQPLNVAAGQTVRLQQVLTAAGTQNVNVITTRGQQFVITSQVNVPGLTQAGMTRILNIAPSSRVSVMGTPPVAGRTGTLHLSSSTASDGTGRGSVSLVTVNASSHPTLVSSLSTPPRQSFGGLMEVQSSTPALVLASSTQNTGRTSSFATPPTTSQTSISSSQNVQLRKRHRPVELQEIPPPNEKVSMFRQGNKDLKAQDMHASREGYAEECAELFFLNNGGTLVDYPMWRKRASTAQFLHFLRTNRLDPSDDDEDLTMLLASTSHLGAHPEVKVVGSGSTPVALSTTLPPAVAQLNQQGGTPLVPEPSSATHGGRSSSTPSLTMSSGHKLNKLPLVSPLSRLHTRQHSISAVYDTSIGSQEQIAEKAKQEAYVMQRIVELQRDGLWAERRLPKAQEPPRAKAHWDYLVEEMVWLAADFAQERKWKKAAAKKCARNVQKFFQEKVVQAKKEEKIQELRLKKIAAIAAKEIKTFWSNVEKVVEYKQQTILEEKRKKALDQHLSFIVDQTEKYSTWLAESMNKTGLEDANKSVNASTTSSRISSPSRLDTTMDDEFQPNLSSTDDEETIAKEEEDMGTGGNFEEIELLKRESELTLEDLLKQLPDDYLNTRDTVANDGSEKGSKLSSKSDVHDANTSKVEQSSEGKVKNEKAEKLIAELHAENKMSIDELMAKYGGVGALDYADEEMDSDDEKEETEEEEEVDSVESLESVESEDESDEEQEDEDEDEEIGLKSLMDDGGAQSSVDNEAAGKEINDVAALAESIQPTGNTLSSTSVVTPIPFLLKHTLREYQHIGLDWLVTMFDRKLNGILADEMGLGKTIQTIALLAHLACEKGNWGPHLIIVPTSVMLNWEMELKKWCPAFKILTYYGAQKERKQKRTGWTKPNAFHICITSYKLVIQDHQSFRRKKWKYLILDEAQNIKNFKSQRWQLLLNFQTQRRLLLTGTPLQNNLMELWSLMHFLMPNVFQSHREFKEWFSNPVTGMIEGNSEYNESIIKRLHKVLRPFLLRRLKCEVEKQLPKKYEHVVICRLSKRQRYLYDDFMSRAKTRETLATGNLLSVINVLMQLRKVCNHPNLFEVRPTISPFQMEGITYHTASLFWTALEYDVLKHVDLYFLNFLLMDLEVYMPQYIAHRIRKLQAPKKLIEEIDSVPAPPPPCPSGLKKIQISRLEEPIAPSMFNELVNNVAKVGTSPLVKTAHGTGITYKVSGGFFRGRTIQLVPSTVGIRAIPVHPPVPAPPPVNQATQPTVAGVSPVKNVPAGFAQLVQTPTGRHILLTSSPQAMQPLGTQNQSLPGTTTVLTVSGQRLAVFSKPVGGVGTSVTPSSNRLSTTSTLQSVRPTLRATSLATSIITGTTTASTVSTTSLNQPSSTSLGQYTVNNVPSGSSNATTRSEVKHAGELKAKQDLEYKSLSAFHMVELEEYEIRRRREKLSTINYINAIRCQAHPIYGVDLKATLSIENIGNSFFGSYREGVGLLHCLNALKPTLNFWTQTTTLRSAICLPHARVDELQDIFARFVLVVPAVSAPHPCFHVSHPSPSRVWKLKRTQTVLQQELSSRSALLHPIASAMSTQFPHPRLIQYDCGKLQVLDKLLRQLKAGHHRVLIFTQMTRMLDVLEAFLNFHGHIYLRLDGTTRVDQRQLLMERFNADTRLFCFILSTRSGGIGVNLTGADTVIFYDSDWNPTMDAQAQDRCHRIGQTRDVHIYRLVSEMTVEENILKKANQKRLLGEVAIEGGNFTTAFFKSSTIQDLFNVDVSENSASQRMAEVLESNNHRDRKQAPTEPSEDKGALCAFESALAAAEDDFDVQAARTAKAEAAADLAEFDETIPLEEMEGEPELSKAEQEIKNILLQLNPIELYAMKFVENSEAAWSAEQMAAAEAEIENQKREWELGRLRAQQEEEERRARLADDDEMLTFSREDAQNQVWVSDKTREQMPMWCPPTPPHSGSDVYIDYSLAFLYEQTTMSESQLPPVYVKRERRRMRIDMIPSSEREGRRPSKIRHKEESFFAPRSLFDRPTPAVLKMRRDLKLQKYRGLVRPPVSIPGLKPAVPLKPYVEPENMPDWTINEDWAILQTVQETLGLPLNLVVISPGHMPNWDLVADMVNSVSAIYRSPKQCRNRYEGHIVPREEGKVLYDSNPKKQKKIKGVYKLQPQTNKPSRPMRTSQLHIQNNNLTRTQALTQCYEVTKAVANKRTPTVKPLLVNPALNNPKHAVVIADSGIDYDSPMAPPEVAHRRAERIAMEKQKSAQAAVAAQVQTPDSRLPQQQQQQQAVVAKVASSSPGPSTSSPLVPQSQAVVVASPSQVQVSNPTTPAVAAPSTRPVTRPVSTLTMQDVVAAANQARSGVSNAGSPTMVTVANLSSAQMQVAQRLASVNLVSQAQTAVTVVTTKGIATGTGTAAGKTINPAQLHLFRQQQQLVRQQQQRILRDQQVKALQASGQKMSVAVTTSNTLGCVTTVQVSPTQRTQFIKQTAPGGKQMTRPMTDTELAALVKRQQQLQAAQKASGQQIPVTQQGGLTPVQILAQAGLQVQTPNAGPQMATLVKTVANSSGSTQSLSIPMSNVTLPQVKGTLATGMKAATPLQIRQIQQQLLQQQQQRKIPGQKITQLTQVGSKGAQLLVQSQKAMPTTMTFQQLNQVIKQVAPQHITHVTGGQTLTQSSGGQVISHHAVLAKAGASGQSIAQTSGGQVISHAMLAKATGQSTSTGQTLTQTSGGQIISHAVLAKAAASGQMITQAGGSPIISHAVFAKAATQTTVPGQTLQARVIPVSSAQQSLKQTIQVVGGVRSGVPNVTIDSAGRPQVTTTSTLQSALAGNLKVTSNQQHAMLSQVGATMQGQSVSMAVRQAGHAPLRLQTSGPLIAVTMPHPVQVAPTPVTAAPTTGQPSSSQDTQPRT